MKPLVYVTRKIPEEVLSRLQENYEVDMWPKEEVQVPRDMLLDKAKTADALLTVISDQLDEELFSQSEHLKVVANMAVGYDNVDLAAASKHGVAICNTPDVLTDTTADLAFALLLATARRMVEAAEYLKRGKWKSWSPMLLSGTDVHHKTIGIIGMGKIGTAVAKRAAGFDMEIIYHNRSRHEVAEEMLGARYCTKEELLAEADFVVCLAPLTDETKGMFGREQFQQMKKHAIFINASRGPIVDEEALYKALVEGDIAAAGLDVFHEEPVSPDHPLVQLDNVVALPHIGSASRETRLAMMELCCDNLDAIFADRTPKTLVNKDVLNSNR
ncbi:2-hydroxyacid dehydrogenase [Bacillus thermotolerans]|uniref:Glyoxylate/hydroxypyruvate reductase B n=1 Tax=Bacillus thermotolerans TaxID=1221996 RepID=A0A0F5I8A3_BACTR|nr:D-glycerate dehydrogenase [Bacillus thermotolerans]KKB41859.1 Glyoxylate reductase [Bacillus thermotolerans]